jgi:hypothetical protein
MRGRETTATESFICEIRRKGDYVKVIPFKGALSRRADNGKDGAPGVNGSI